MNTSDRSNLDFVEKVRKAFAFLDELGFSEIEARPTLVRYQKAGIEVDVYHGRQSYEIGAGVTAFGIRYTIAEIIRANDPEAEKNFSYPTATTLGGVVAGLDELTALMKRYGRQALDANPQFFLTLKNGRELWSSEYALDVLAGQLKPQADEAFRRRDYWKAVELYSRIRERLSPAQIKKLHFAEKHSSNRKKTKNKGLT